MPKYFAQKLPLKEKENRLGEHRHDHEDEADEILAVKTRKASNFCVPVAPKSTSVTRISVTYSMIPWPESLQGSLNRFGLTSRQEMNWSPVELFKKPEVNNPDDTVQ